MYKDEKFRSLYLIKSLNEYQVCQNEFSPNHRDPLNMHQKFDLHNTDKSFSSIIITCGMNFEIE